MSSLEVADIFRAHGPHWRSKRAGHLSLGQLKVMSAIERCRSAALGGHVLQCPACEHTQIAYNSCRNRHCPKCQASAARRWLEARQADLLPVDYYHLVFTLPAPISDIAYYNKSVVYGILFKAAAETLRTIAGDPRHLGARIGATLVLHTWGSAMTHPRRAGTLQFFGEHQALAKTKSFSDWLKPLRHCEWVVYAKRPFAGPDAVLAYLSRYTHRVAIANSRLIAMDKHGVTFKWKDYRAKERVRHKTMTLAADEFMRRFLLHVLPSGFHRIRHYGLIANTTRRDNLAQARELLLVEKTIETADTETNGADTAEGGDESVTYVCPDCGAPMIIIETFERGQLPRAPPVRVDQS